MHARLDIVAVGERDRELDSEIEWVRNFTCFECICV